MMPAAIGSGVAPKIAGPAKPQNRNVASDGDEHERDEHRADAVGEALHRGLGALRVLDEAHDLSERGVGAHLGRAEPEAAQLVHGRADDGVARGLLDRDRLAGEHRLVDCRGALDEHAVDRDLLAGTDHDEVAHDDLLDGDVGLFPATHDAGGLGRQTHERLDGVARAALCARLEQLAQQHEGDEQRARLVEDRLHLQRRNERRRHAVEVRRRGTDGDERVHVAGALLQRAPRTLVEARSCDELHRGGEQEHDVLADLHRVPRAAHGRRRATRRSPAGSRP